jgi:Heat induced stress protein YflT
MNQTVYGVFNSSDEVIQVLQSLKQKGYRTEDITLLANNKESLDFADRYPLDGVNTLTNEESTFIENVKSFFTAESTGTLANRLTDAGISNAEVTQYVKDAEEGNILVLIGSSAGSSFDAEDSIQLDEDDNPITKENYYKNRINTDYL